MASSASALFPLMASKDQLQEGEEDQETPKWVVFHKGDGRRSERRDRRDGLVNNPQTRPKRSSTRIRDHRLRLRFLHNQIKLPSLPRTFAKAAAAYAGMRRLHCHRPTPPLSPTSGIRPFFSQPPISLLQFLRLLPSSPHLPQALPTSTPTSTIL